MPTQEARRGEKTRAKASRGKASEWPVLLPKKLTQKAAQIADDVANRLIDTDLLVENLNVLGDQGPDGFRVVWNRESVAQGFSGLAVMSFQLERCNPGEGWGRVGTQFMKLATCHATDFSGLSASLCDGAAGVAFSAMLSPSRSRFRTSLLELADERIERCLPETVGEIKEQRNVTMTKFDVLYGITGTGRYLLSRVPDERSERGLRLILETLIEMSREHDGVLGFYSPFETFGPEDKETTCGSINCGLAHGVPGPLTLMALSLREGVSVDGLREATESLAEWLVAQILKDDFGINWPGNVPIKDTDAELPALVPSRVAWCYGSPGVARALWLAGDSLNIDRYQDIAVEAMEAAYKKPVDVQRIDAPTICHGVAGVLQCTLRFAADTRLPMFTDAAAELTEQLISFYDPKLFWGFQDKLMKKPIDNPAFLYGACGVVLALLAAAYPVEPRWDGVLLLS